MPDTPLIIGETSTYSRRTDRMRSEDDLSHLSEEEKIVAQNSLLAYCTPGSYYEIVRRRAIKNPLFLQRNLRYKIQAKHEMRIRMNVFLPGTTDQKMFPLHILLARLVSPKPIAEFSAVYKFSRAYVLTGVDGVSKGQAKFLIPDMDRLALKDNLESLAILVISFADAQNSQVGIDSNKIPSEGHCLWGKIPLESLYSRWKIFPIDLGQKLNSVFFVEMQPCFIKLKSMSEEKKCVLIQVPSKPFTSSSQQKVEVAISAQEVGPTKKSPYIYTVPFNDIPSSSMLRRIRMRKGKVDFNYKYYHNTLQKTEVSLEFSCTICLAQCGSFKGLECHLLSCHRFFNFEFLVTENLQAVNVSLNEALISKFFSNRNYEKDFEEREPYFFCTKKAIRRKQKSLVGNSSQGPHKTEDAECVKTEKSQPMALEQVLAERDSEDKVDVADFEDTKIVDVAKDEEKMMHMWDLFVRKHRVFADDDIPWACEAFSKLHGPFMVRTPHLVWCWKMYMVKLWNNGLLDPRTMNNCNHIFEQLAN